MDNSYFVRIANKSGKINKILPLLYPELPYGLLMKLVRKKDVTIQGKRANADSFINVGDKVSLFLMPQLVPIDVVFENNDIFCVNKGKGVPSDGEHSLQSLVSFARPGSIMLHRLDTNTQGLVMFAKSQQVAEFVIDAMKNGLVEKTYLATVFGEVNFKDTIISGYLKKDAKNGRVKIYHSPINGATPVSLLATTLSQNNGLTTLQVTIHNGKTHQIRAQLADAGYFIIGDGKYGDDRINKLYGFTSQQLCAVKIQFKKIPNDRFGLSNLCIRLQNN